MIYLDTSFVAPLVIAEESSEAIEATIMKVKPGELATGLWTQIELASLVARKLRMGELSATDADAVRRECKKILDESFKMLLPTAADFATATTFLEIPKTGLRAGDAMHLAIAANHGARKIWSLDQGFIKAGKLLKLPVSAG
jgi:predicted nucleic acid-binding protein